MSTGYTRCDEDVYEMLRELMNEYRTDLIETEAKIHLLFAVSDKGHATKAKGQKILGKCKINSLIDHTQGMADATITLDMKWWKDASSRRRRALLHHELSHIETYDSEDGLDDSGRPALKSRHGDWDFDGFVRLVKLYGEDSCERINLTFIQKALNQLEMFEDEPEQEQEQEATEEEGVRETSVSFSGSDFGKIREMAKQLRKRAKA